MSKTPPFMISHFSLALVIVMVMVLFSQAIFAQTTAFTYQGRLAENGQPANGDYDFEFSMFGSPTLDDQYGPTLNINSVSVTDEVFTVQLDFGSIFPDGNDRYLQIRVRAAGGGGYTLLTPRQYITSTPYASRSLRAGTAYLALASNTLEGYSASHFAFTTDPRLSNDRNPLPNSTHYIQNRTSQQSSSNFHISGTGTAQLFNSDTVYRIAGNTVLDTSGTRNTLVGIGAGPLITGGERNTFVGELAGSKTLDGDRNTFVGSGAGADNETGSDNSLFGYNAGLRVTSGNENSIFGVSAGGQITNGLANSIFGYEAGFNASGNGNSFFGGKAGRNSTSGIDNAFFGKTSGENNTEGNWNTFIGESAGRSNLTGDRNTFLGRVAGIDNTTGTDNTIIGAFADVGSGNLFHATAIGADAVVTSNSTIQLGRHGEDFIRIGKLGSSALAVGHVCISADNFLTACNARSEGQVDIGQAQIDELVEILGEQADQIATQAEELENLKTLVCSQNQSAVACTN